MHLVDEFLFAVLVQATSSFLLVCEAEPRPKSGNASICGTQVSAGPTIRIKRIDTRLLSLTLAKLYGLYQRGYITDIKINAGSHCRRERNLLDVGTFGSRRFRLEKRFYESK